MSDIKLPKHVVDKVEARWWSKYSAEGRQRSTAVDQRLEQIRAHRNNIQRYRQLLTTKLSELERQFIERRLAEETDAARLLADDIPPISRQTPQMLNIGSSGQVR